MKRTKMLTLAIMGSLALAGCSPAEPPKAEPTTYKDVSECVKDGKEVAVCEKSFAEAKALTEQNAPKFGSLAECQAQFGPNGCTGGSNTQGSFFMPLLMGYMIGNMMSNSSGRSYYEPSRPVYRSARGGTQAASFTNGRYTTTPAAPSYAARAAANAPMTSSASRAATTSSRGGFGGRSSSSSS